MNKEFTEREHDRIIEMAWEDRTPFEAIEFQFGVTEAEVIKIMQKEMKPSSFKMWRKRVQGIFTKLSMFCRPSLNSFSPHFKA